MDRNLREIKDRIGNLDAKISQAYSEELKAKADFDSAIAHEDRAVQEELLAIEQLRAARRDELSKRETITGQKLAINERRRQFMAELSGVQRSITEFELKLRKLDPSGTVSLANLLKIREQLDDRVKGDPRRDRQKCCYSQRNESTRSETATRGEASTYREGEVRNRIPRGDIGTRSKRNLNHDFLGTAP